MLKEKNSMLLPEKMKILQENTKMMHRYSSSSNNDVIR